MNKAKAFLQGYMNKIAQDTKEDKQDKPSKENKKLFKLLSKMKNKTEEGSEIDAQDIREFRHSALGKVTQRTLTKVLKGAKGELF